MYRSLTIQRAETLYRAHLAGFARLSTEEQVDRPRFTPPLAVDLTRRLNCKTKPPRQSASTSPDAPAADRPALQDASLAPLDSEAHDALRTAPDVYALDADEFGLIEDDYALVEIVEDGQIEAMDLSDEDPFEWGPWG